MKPKIYVHKYLMHSRHGLNSRSLLTEHEGALIRVEEGGVPGFGCLHPWVELGDLNLGGLLKQLKDGRTSRQIKRALECADIDRDARARGVNLFDGLEVPMSHGTVVGGVDRVEQAVVAGFDTVKLKMGRDEVANLHMIREVCGAFPELRIRLDFNGVSSAGAMEYFLREAGGVLRQQIDFIEDPFPLGDSGWDTLRDKYGLKFAVDRGVSNAFGEYDVSVVKPVINKIQKICDAAQMDGRNVVVTSYMDHPVGQSYAAYCAGKANEQYLGLINKRCGLVTHGLYEPTEFTERLGVVGPEWNCGENGTTGLGFDDLLDDLNWKKI